MLGEKGYKGQMVTQAAWVRSLLAAMIKSWEGRGVTIGGLFGAPVGCNDTVLPWSRADQAAFLIAAGQHLHSGINEITAEWVDALRKHDPDAKDNMTNDPAIFSRHSLLNQDQGIRTFLHVLNDIAFVLADELGLEEWGGKGELGDDDDKQVTASLLSLKHKSKINDFLKELGIALAGFDWRASSAPGLSDDERTLRAAFRGSGGYKELRRKVLQKLSERNDRIGVMAKEVYTALGFER